jgi:aspartyl-tRNA(Asn)/glutamyl-tRNA(Gln) amidotransferase subunit A
MAGVSADGNAALLSLTEMAAAIAGRRVTSRAIVEACLRRIAVFDESVAAFITVDADDALAAADRADAAVARGERLGPLHGVPLAHKDMFYRPDRDVTCGSRVRAHFRTPEKATVLRRLEQAGAIDLGALAMVEFAMGPHGYNANLRHCRNPWQLDHVPCGSSSGSGVAVATRFVAGALGSDTGGSIRCPASASGVTGLLPTYSRVSRAGVMPMSFSLDCVGPLARTAADCARLMNAIAGPDPLDPTASQHPVSDYEAGLDLPLAGLRVGLPDSYFDVGVAPEVAARLEDARDLLRRLGATLVEVRIPSSIGEVADLHPLVMKAEGAANHQLWMRERPAAYTTEVRHRLQAGYFVPATDYLQALKARGALLREFAEAVFAEADILFAPVLPKAAPTIAETTTASGPAYLEMVVSLTRNTKVCNFLGLPAISVPCGFTAAGLPVSFQAIGRPFSEKLLLRVAHRYQSETDWHRRVPPLAEQTEVNRL